MAFRVGDVVAEVGTAEVMAMAIIVEEGLLEREGIGVAEVGLVGLLVVAEEVDLDSNRYVDVRFGFLDHLHVELQHVIVCSGMSHSNRIFFVEMPWVLVMTL